LIFEIVAIGNELLIGKTLDTNSNWLARQITEHGGELRRITTVADGYDDIASGVGGALSRKPNVLITLGGLGPTHDDMTLASISRFLGRRLTLNRDALELLRRRYLQRFGPSVKLTQERVKMAKFPEGAVPLPNPVGTAPAPCLTVRGINIVALPGVPREMRAIFRESVLPMIERRHGRKRFYDRSIRVAGIPESSLSPIIDQVMRRYGSVYIKSHPRGIERTTGAARIELHFQTWDTSSTRAETRLTGAVTMMKQRLRGKATVRNA
jgi:molybdenum cofactor synthesis domain-containing protein